MPRTPAARRSLCSPSAVGSWPTSACRATRSGSTVCADGIAAGLRGRRGRTRGHPPHGRGGRLAGARRPGPERHGRRPRRPVAGRGRHPVRGGARRPQRWPRSVAPGSRAGSFRGAPGGRRRRGGRRRGGCRGARRHPVAPRPDGRRPTPRPVERTARHRARQFAPVARGLLVAIPLVVVFVALFSSADAVFDRLPAQRWPCGGHRPLGRCRPSGHCDRRGLERCRHPGARRGPAAPALAAQVGRRHLPPSSRAPPVDDGRSWRWRSAARVSAASRPPRS